MRRRTALALAVGLVLAVAAAVGPAAAHEGDPEGHIASNANYGFEVVGRLAPAGVQQGRYTDVWSDGDTAYVGTFHSPSCDRSGVHVIDIADPSDPRPLAEIESPPNTRVNDVKTVRMDTKHFTGTVLIHTLEPCGMTIRGTSDTVGQGGISLWDVTNPAKPVTLKSRFLDFGVHNTYPWVAADGRVYAILVDNDHAVDTHIVELTKPQSPKLVSSTGLPRWSGVNVDGNGGDAGLHDVWVERIAGRDIALLSYWDAGFVKLDVTDPANPVFLGDSDYPSPDAVTGFDPPEGNAHAAAFSADGSLVFAGDEDFAASRSLLRILGGTNAGAYASSEGAFTTPISSLADETLNGSTTYLGLGCDPSDSSLPAAVEDGDDTTDELAVMQRGACRFDTKAQTAINRGYDGFVVFNDAARGDAVVTMGGDSRDIAGVFVGHSTGLKIFGAAQASELAIGQTGEAVSAAGEYDGYGYFHLLEAGSLAHRGHYAPQELNNPAFAHGFGDLTMHNVEGDPDLAESDRAYIAWYSLGMRAVEVAPGFSIETPGPTPAPGTPAADVRDYYAENVKEVGRFIAPEGSNFWGVHVHETAGGDEYVLASDRNTGLWIFRFTG